MVRLTTVLALLFPLALGAQGRVADSPNDIQPLLIGATIPDLILADINGESVRLTDLVSRKPTVLIYYRGGWCPFCNRQLQQLMGLEPALENLGYQIIAISSDRPSKLKESMAKNKVDYLLLSDSTMTGAKRMGLAWKMSEQQVGSYRMKMMDVEDGAGMNHHIVPVPGVFILDQKGIIRFQYVNPNHRERLSSAVLESAAKELR